MKWIRTTEGIYLNADQIVYICDEPLNESGTADIIAYMSNGDNFVLTYKQNSMDFECKDGTSETRGLDDEMMDIFIYSLISLISDLELVVALDMDRVMLMAEELCKKRILEKFRWTKKGWERKKRLNL